MKARLPVLFIGHGSPENAIEDNQFSRGWQQLAARLPRPKAILCISAHWLTEGVGVTVKAQPKTIHDFYGFQKELYQIKYRAPGSPELAEEVKKRVKAAAVVLDDEWGFDHGCWVPLIRMFPDAAVPVIQLSMYPEAPAQTHYQIGRELSGLREEGVLIIGSGNLVHNLMLARMNDRIKPYPWAVEFDEFVKRQLEQKQHGPLINYLEHKSAGLAHPTNDHYLPLLYVIGAAGKEEKPSFINESIWAASLSMRCVIFDR